MSNKITNNHFYSPIIIFSFFFFCVKILLRNGLTKRKLKSKSVVSAPNNEQFHMIIFNDRIKNCFPKFCIPQIDRQPYTWSFVEKHWPVVVAIAVTVVGGILWYSHFHFGKIVSHFTVNQFEILFLFGFHCLVFVIWKMGSLILILFPSLVPPDWKTEKNQHTNGHVYHRLSTRIIALILHLSFQQFW